MSRNFQGTYTKVSDRHVSISIHMYFSKYVYGHNFTYDKTRNEKIHFCTDKNGEPYYVYIRFLDLEDQCRWILVMYLSVSTCPFL